VDALAAVERLAQKRLEDLEGVSVENARLRAELHAAR
jgi:hypothetical protein